MDNPRVRADMRPHALGVLALVLLSVSGPVSAFEARGGFPEPAALPIHADPPDPLVMFDGSKVATRKEWEDRRKPELRALFQYYMYGQLPPAVAVSAVVRRTDANAYEGRATLKEISLLFPGLPGVKLNVLLVVPNKRRWGPVPVLVGLNIAGNHAIRDDPAVALPTTWMPAARGGIVMDHRATETGRGGAVSTWAINQSIYRGYAVATCYFGDIFPDKPDFNDGIFPRLFATTPGQRSPGENGPGAIAMWAWGLHRIVDYLVTVPELDKSRIVVTGHSRLGKAALLAAAFDERIALVIPHQAGVGGTAPSRSKNPKAESVAQMNQTHPHWFDDRFKKFNDSVTRLPFDQHSLVALCAPRPVLYTNGIGDQRSDPAGQFEMLKAASPVYRLLGVEGLDASEMPPPGKLVDSRLGYLVRAGPHVADPAYWKIFLDYADKYFKR